MVSLAEHSCFASLCVPKLARPEKEREKRVRFQFLIGLRRVCWLCMVLDVVVRIGSGGL